MQAMFVITEGLPGNDRTVRPRNFEMAFLQICGEHKKKGLALAFAFLLYDFFHPEVIKVLRDRDYWTSLDITSGSRLSVFSFHCPQSTAAQVDLPPISSSTTAVLSKYFEIDDEVPMPSILFFQVHDKKVVDHILVQIRATTVEETYHAFRDAIRVAVEAVKKVIPENYGNSKEVFGLMRERLQGRETLGTVKRGIAKALTIKSFLKALIGF